MQSNFLQAKNDKENPKRQLHTALKIDMSWEPKKLKVSHFSMCSLAGFSI
jgi:hypothetical protein